MYQLPARTRMASESGISARTQLLDGEAGVVQVEEQAGSPTEHETKKGSQRHVSYPTYVNRVSLKGGTWTRKSVSATGWRRGSARRRPRRTPWRRGAARRSFPGPLSSDSPR